ncbi:MAG: HAD family phosphatase [Bryobacteraceae bacterium]
MASRAVLWDLDGTLVDSEQQHWLAWRDTMSAEGVALTFDQFRATFGWRNDAILKSWLGPDIDSQRIARIGDAKEELYRNLVRRDHIEPLPGAAEWVRRLHTDGWLQAVASSAPRLNIDVVMEAIGLADQFQATASAEDVQRGKPDPQVFLLAASRLGVPPARSIVVEDAPAGIEAARRAGMHSIGVRRDGLQLPADIAASSLADLPPDAFTSLIR